MKIQCEICREIVEIGAFRLTSAGIEVTCRACHSQFAVSRTGESTALAPVRARTRAATGTGLVTIRCPKCFMVQPPSPACRGCGLRVDRFAGYAGDDGGSAHAAGRADRIGDLFAACETAWDDRSRHEALAEAVSAEQSFSRAARFYRGALAERPECPIARRQLGRITRMAEATFMSQAAARAAEDRGPEPYKNVLVMLIVLLLLGAAGVGLYSLISPESVQAAPMAITD